MAKIPTTISQLDDMLKGGLAPGSLNCLWLSPGTDGTGFVYQMACSLSQSMKVFYFVNSKSPSLVAADMKEFDFDSSKVNFVDAYSSLIGAKTSSSLLVANPKDPQEFVNEISIIAKKLKKFIIIIDSLSNLIDLSESENLDFLQQIKSLNATTVCLFTEWPYKPATLKKLQSSFETIINVQSVQEKLFFRQYFGVTKHANAAVKGKTLPFRIEKPGGVKIYIPKVLVTGPFNAGKTSFIHSTSQRAVSVDRLGTTVALDHGHVQYENFSVDLFGTPGQQRFDPILKMLGGDALGVIVVVSATDPQGFPRALEMMKKASVMGLPVVFAANKSNLRGALTPQQIQQRLGVKNPVIPMVAQDLTKVQPGLPCQLKKEDFKAVLTALFGSLMRT